jgi:hypothetical protein
MLFLLGSLASLAAGRPDAVASCTALLDAMEHPIRVLQGNPEGVWLRATEIQLERALQIAAGDFDDLGPEARPFAPVWKLPLSVRTRKKLETVGIRRVGELNALSTEALADVSRGQTKVGQLAAEEIGNLLARYDLAMRPKNTHLVVRAATVQDADQMAQIDKRHSGKVFRDYILRGVGGWVAEAGGKVVAFILIANSQSTDGKACVAALQDSNLADELRALEPQLFCVAQIGVQSNFEPHALAAIYDIIWWIYSDAHFVARFSEHPTSDRELKVFHSHLGFLRFSPKGIYVRLAN